ncbi:MAG TPA: hypothetical protein PLW65_11675 [Pseudomonadota bacterium]|nr:hypothetical protein [Pseudomonadota bacterium]
MNAHDLNKFEHPDIRVRLRSERPSHPGTHHLTFPGDKPVSTPEDEAAARQSTESDPEQEKLQADADLLRTQLSHTLESLAQRKQKVVEVAHEVTHSALPLAIAGAGAVVAVVGGGLLIAHSARKRQHPPLTDRLHAAAEVFRHPERARHPEQRPLSEEIGRAAVVSLSSFFLTQLAKYAMERLTQSKPPKKEQPSEL